MKKIYYILVSVVMVMALVSCGNKAQEDNKEDSNENKMKDCRVAIQNNDFETAHQILDELHDSYLGEDYNNSTFKTAKNLYFSALSSVYNAEIGMILSESTDDCSDKICYLISEIPLDGICPSSGLCRYYDGCDIARDSYGDVSDSYRYYQSCNAMNKICDKAINLAIRLNNKDVARAVVELYKDDINVTLGSSDPIVKVDGVQVDGNHAYIKFTTDSKDAARKKVNDAFK